MNNSLAEVRNYLKTEKKSLPLYLAHTNTKGEEKIQAKMVAVSDRYWLI